ncbi:molybdopterin biosynthesis protein [Haloarchaeobius iranensis]|uniref:molybdopterin biosynthesis protein n=1 Tax=Haloarchaeobius iranensis TaxID=996166 RepID=UPI0015872400|nr:molybdopterin biosynthesis protein [Haloarchaeobius iranensis]
MVAVRKEFRELAPPEAAHEAIASLDLEPEPETVPLGEARGRVLAERIDAERDVPGFDRAKLDGYALRATDTFGASETEPATLDLVGRVDAGTEPDVTVGVGECVEISTGAVMPDGADAMVMVEETDLVGNGDGDEQVAVRSSVTPGGNVAFAGTDVAAGERALGPGTRITPREVGLLSALGVDEVPVKGQPTVGIVSTGEELVRPGDELHDERGQIYDVNSYSVAAGVADAGGVPELYPHTGDDYDEMERVLSQAADECDLVLSSGSTSASAVDVVYRVVEERGELLVHGVAVKPGKPMLVGELDDSAYVGLPGYPVSALTIFRTFVAPAIRRAAGLPESAMATTTGVLAERERHAEGRHRFVSVGLVEDGDGRTLVSPVDKGSGATTSLAEADGVVEMPADVTYLDAGETVTVQLFSPDVRPPALFGVGEDDPLLSLALDRVPTARYLGVGTRPGLRRLRADVPDVAVVSGPVDLGRESEADEPPVLAEWEREWGLVVPDGNPDDVTGLADPVDDDLRFVNRTTASGLRTTLANALADLADERGVERHDVVESIDGFDAGRRAHESPARVVKSGGADVALGLRATAEKLAMGFVPCGDERVRLLGNPDRVEKRGVQQLVAAVDPEAGLADGLAGYSQ